MLTALLRNQTLNIKVSRESSYTASLPLRICHCCSSEPETTVEGQAVHPQASSEEHDGAKCQLSSFTINHQQEGDRCLPEEFGRYHQGAG